MNSIYFELTESIGKINKAGPVGWNKELNRVIWNGGREKFDIRDWDVRHERMTRGAKFDDVEMEALVRSFEVWLKARNTVEKAAANSPILEMETETYSFKFLDRIGVIREFGNGWKKEIRVMSWNGNEAKVDIRDWSPNGLRMSRGIVLTEEQMRKVCELYREYRARKAAEEAA